MCIFGCGIKIQLGWLKHITSQSKLVAFIQHDISMVHVDFMTLLLLGCCTRFACTLIKRCSKLAKITLHPIHSLFKEPTYDVQVLKMFLVVRFDLSWIEFVIHAAKYFPTLDFQTFNTIFLNIWILKIWKENLVFPNFFLSFLCGYVCAVLRKNNSLGFLYQQGIVLITEQFPESLHDHCFYIRSGVTSY